MPNIPLRATGTEDPQACAQQQPQQRIREPMQRGAARCDEHSARDHNTNDRKPYQYFPADHGSPSEWALQ